MGAQIIRGTEIAAQVKNEVKEEAGKLIESGVKPGLAFVLVGDNPSSKVYVRMKNRACEELGINSITHTLPGDISEEELLEVVSQLNADSSVHGILVQLPLPRQIREEVIISSIDPGKDVDGFHPVNVGKLVQGQAALKSCTPYGIQVLLERSGVSVQGKHVVVVGRSNIVGKPLANLLMLKDESANATVTVCHSATPDIPYFTRMADILVVAIGKPEFVRGNMVNPGAVVVDVGVNRVDDPSSEKGYRLVGDVDFDEVVEVAGAITPVPGGVGPMTIAMLMKNTIAATKASVETEQG
jgi:methylenetetrahydrofolate dehydrogenase (NADP+)/methenyltetrahydrofolate cyclohydrolase